MNNKLKEALLNWYNSLNPRDRKVLMFFLSAIMPILSGWILTRQLATRTNIENKLNALPSVNFIKNQIITAEKEGVFYKQNIPKLKAQILNPNIYYANDTSPNQIPIILHNQIKQAGGYLLSMQEGLPMTIEVNEYGLPAVANSPKKAEKNNKKQANKNISSNKIFKIELIPIKLSIAVSKSYVSSFLENLNKPNNSYPLLFINSIIFGKNGCNIGNLFSNSNYYVINTYQPIVDYKTPMGVCMSGYVLSKIEPLRENENAKQKK